MKRKGLILKAACSLCLLFSIAAFSSCGDMGELYGQPMQGEQGVAGVGIASIAKTATDGNVDTYTITLSDGNTVTFTVTNGTDGKDGVNGQDGKDGVGGVKGEDGTDGQDGQDGISITGAEINANGELILSFSQGNSINLGKIVGEKGQDGKEGVGIDEIDLTANGDLTIMLSNGTSIELGNIRGEKGDKGDQGEQGVQGEKGDKGDQGLSAYEIFIKHFPDYFGDEKQWITDVAMGNTCNLFGHDCQKEIIDPTCKTQGYTIYDCNICDYVENKDYVSNAAHYYYGGVCKWCGYHEALENAQYVTTEDGWVVAVEGDSAFLMTYCGEGVDMFFPTSYKGTALNFDYFSFNYNLVYSKLKRLWTCSAYDCVIREEQFSGFPALEAVRIDTGIIRMGAFRNCDNLKMVIIGEGIRELETFCFGDCKKLTSIDYLAEEAQCIGSRPYVIFSNAGCDTDGLELRIGEKVKCIPDELFGSHTWYDDHPKITKVIISLNSNLQSIHEWGFYRCSELKEIIIPNTVANIDSNAFAETDLRTVYFKGSTDEWSEIDIHESNTILLNATIYYYSEEEPTEEGNYWHYDTDGVTPIIWAYTTGE